ncbi:NAD-dependent epimerase/dehydratase family protein [Nocardia goodfellowii]|uniref:UDP-glucose 4-epimerase n=1 Tax=Nocardia goodfellowii TaxID=882446 RepID=A0ABS4QPE9_9NOCA|nr:NAD-dependent epimerase/dehydratase family protein [Nocardia goodfellowii]MBP2193597.1 UDP-glucose 4-epimerase [Nocardia goodfellowii]
MRVLVTGANGYIGSSVVAALSAAGHEPVAMVRKPGLDIAGASQVRVADLVDIDSLREAVRGVDAVCHLAGLTRARESFAEPLRYFRVNVSGTIALLDAMHSAEVRRIVFASTGSIYGTPNHQPMNETLPDAPPHPYASSKLAAELAIEAQAGSGDLAAVVVRILNVAGGADPDPTRLVPRILAAASGGPSLAVNGDGTAVRDYLNICDAANAFVACIEHLPDPGNSARYNIGSGRGTSIMDVVAATERVTGRRVSVEHKPPASEPASLINDPSKAITEIGWAPRYSAIDEIVRDAWMASALL